MATVLLDTHVWAWSLYRSESISAAALAVSQQADERYVSPISLFEIAQKTRLGKWPEMAAYQHRLTESMEANGCSAAPFTPEIAVAAGLLDWSHRDPFDRFLAATARHLDMPIVSADRIFDGIVRRIW
jgi:PIN domain nuclease of toxin-antitoxin system